MNLLTTSGIFNAMNEKKTRRHKLPVGYAIVLWIAVAAFGLSLLIHAVSTLQQERIADADRDAWLEERWTERLGGAAPDRIHLSASDSRGDLTVQLWEITANAQQNYDVVVWKRGINGHSRVAYTMWTSAKNAEAFTGFGFSDGFFVYVYSVSADKDRLFGPDKTFHLF